MEDACEWHNFDMLQITLPPSDDWNIVTESSILLAELFLSPTSN